MTIKKRGLGRGLDILLGTSSDNNTPPTRNELRNLPVHLLQRGKYQPRQEIQAEALQELADSIKKQGIIQPIIVRAIANNRYEIIAGERRWRAAQLAGLSEVPAILRNVPDEAAIAMALIENIQRENLNPLEEAIALQRLLDEFSMTHQQIAEAVGKSRTTITNILRLLALHPQVKHWVEQGQLQAGHAKVLLGLQDSTQVEAARLITAKSLSVREAELLVAKLQQTSAKKPAKKGLAPDLRRLQQDLSDTIGSAVFIHHTNKGKGKLVIQYYSLDELDSIFARLRGS